MAIKKLKCPHCGGDEFERTRKEHNRKICNAIDDGSKFPFWVVTAEIGTIHAEKYHCAKCKQPVTLQELKR